VSGPREHGHHAADLRYRICRVKLSNMDRVIRFTRRDLGSERTRREWRGAWKTKTLGRRGARYTAKEARRLVDLRRLE